MTDTNETAGDEIVTPEEHAEVTEGIEPTTDVSAPTVPDDVEVGARSADMDEPSTEHLKVFVLGPNPIAPKANPYTEKNGYDHEPNKVATRQYAISQGLWPTGDVRFVSAKRHPDGVSWVLTYGVEVVPAHDVPDGSRHPEVVGEAKIETDDEGQPTGELTTADAVNANPTAEDTEDQPTE